MVSKCKMRFSVMLVLVAASPSVPVAQTFRIPRPVADRYALNGSYLYAETNFGYPHRGVDIPMAVGDSVYSVGDGWAYELGYEPEGCGKYIMLQSEWRGEKVWYLYCHLSRADFISAGDSVRIGDLIGLAGSTGNSTGPHLHFEIRIRTPHSGRYGNRRNPELWFAMNGMGAIYGRIPGVPDGTRVDISPDPKPRPPYTTYSYTLTYTFDGFIGSDDVYQENYAIGDVKPGVYSIDALGGAYHRVVRVEAGQVVNADATTGVADGGVAPGRYTLKQNFPNPFWPETTVRFVLPQSQPVTVDIFNLLGQRVVTLFDGVGREGENLLMWDGRDRTGGEMPAGVYLYVMRSGPVLLRRRMVKMR